jgi:hypothetical protein
MLMQRQVQQSRSDMGTSKGGLIEGVLIKGECSAKDFTEPMEDEGVGNVQYVCCF